MYRSCSQAQHYCLIRAMLACFGQTNVSPETQRSSIFRCYMSCNAVFYFYLHNANPHLLFRYPVLQF